MVFHFFAGHGMSKKGQQHLLINEFDAKGRYYKMFNAECKIRTYAKTFQNSYHIGVFASCREEFDPDHALGFPRDFKPEDYLKLSTLQCKECDKLKMDQEIIKEIIQEMK
jgi:hypothetical protein